MADHSRFKIGRMCRQIGKSFIIALEVVNDAMETGADWVLLSAGERQSKELMEKVKQHCQAYMLAASDIVKEDYDVKDAKYTMLTITLPNGARIIGLPANPDTARGFTANVVLDEFAFHRDSGKIWRALYPTINRGYKIRIVSTPQGLGNKFYSLCTQENKWSKHVVDIHQAITDGVPFNAEELRIGLDDPDAWDQEYLVLFIDDASAWLDYQMISAVASEFVPKELKYEDMTDADFERIRNLMKGRTYGGLDIGRRRDLSVLDIEDLVGDVFWNIGTIILPKARLTTQKEVLWKVMDLLNMERVCIDGTGIGMTIGEDTVAKYGSSKAECVEFTLKVKQDLAVRTKGIFEDRRCRVANCQTLRDDLHSVKKIVTAANNVRFDAERTEKGHADRFWAKSLAFMASDMGVEVPMCYTSSGSNSVAA
jgi:phage FluMu gp28-like protein